MEVKGFFSKLEKLIEEGKDEEAERFIIKETTTWDKKVIAEKIIDIGIDYGMKDKHNWALAYFELAEKIFKKESNKMGIYDLIALAHLNIGSDLDKMGRNNEAEKEYKLAIFFKKDLSIAYVQYGLFLMFTRNQMEDAEELFRKALEYEKNNEDAHLALGMVLYRLGKLKDARKSVRNAIKCKDDFAEAHNVLGGILSEFGRKKDAKKAYLKAIEINPNFAHAFSNLGLLYVDMKKEKEAEKCYVEALKLDPDDPGINGNLALLLFKLNRLEEARDKFEKASANFLLIGLNSYSQLNDGYIAWIQARLSWGNKQWSKSKNYYIEASNHISQTKYKNLSKKLEIMSRIIFVSKDYRDAICSENLFELKERISKIYKEYTQTFIQIKKEKFYDFNLFKAQFNCIKVLFFSLDFKKINEELLEDARRTFREYRFINLINAVDSLSHFVREIKKFDKLCDIELQGHRNLLLLLQPCDVLDGYISREVDRRLGEQLSFQIKKELQQPIINEIRKSESRLSYSIRNESQRVITALSRKIDESQTKILLLLYNQHNELVTKIDNLNILESKEFKSLIQEEIERTLERVKNDNERQEFNKYWDFFKNKVQPVVSFVAGTIGIYNFVTTGNFDLGTALSIQMIERLLDKVK